MLAEFPTPEALLEGTRKMRESGYKGLDTHTPYPMHGIEEALGLERPKIPTHRPRGGDRRRAPRLRDDLLHERGRLADQHRQPAAARPPAFIPITFELAVLLGGFVGLLRLSSRCSSCPSPTTRCSSRRTSGAPASTPSFCRSRCRRGKRPDDIMDDARLLGAVHVEVVEEVR